jgi:hypothetical protein
MVQTRNRVNVALSRAKHGLFIMGNATQLAESRGMWSRIIDELTLTDAIGNGWPVMCARHPETLRYASRPGEIKLLSPDGEFFPNRLIHGLVLTLS